MNPVKQRKRKAAALKATARRIAGWLATGIDHSRIERDAEGKAARKERRRRRMKRKRQRGWA